MSENGASEGLPPCRSCGGTSLRQFLDLGKTPLADAILTEDALDAPEGRFPLAVAFCPECALVQITEEVPAEQLFVDNYHYYSSFSDYLLQHSKEHADGLIQSQGLGPDSFVVELASNDGYLLKNFVDAGVPCLGIDPSPGPAEAARQAGVPTLEAFFGVELADKLVAEGHRADVIIANNVMAHVPDLNGFVGGMARLLSDDGVVTVENPYVRDLVQHGEFDTIYHEHFCYYSCTAVDALARRHGLHLNHVTEFPNLHGGTLRWWLGKKDDPSPTATRFLAEEREAGVDNWSYYESFGQRVTDIRDELRALLIGLKADGKTIAAYGAAAKGSTLVNYVDIGTDLVDFVVDRNVHKQGRYMPGTHQPILDPEALIERRPDYVLLLAWNFKDEIISQQQEYLAGGGQFIVPVPKPEVLS